MTPQKRKIHERKRMTKERIRRTEIHDEGKTITRTETRDKGQYQTDGNTRGRREFQNGSTQPERKLDERRRRTKGAIDIYPSPLSPTCCAKKTNLLSLIRTMRECREREAVA